MPVKSENGRERILSILYLHILLSFAILGTTRERKHFIKGETTMAEIEKLKDGELDTVSGGKKYNIGNIPVPVRPYPNGPILYTLTMGDYLVTDGQVIYRDGIQWCHVFTAYGEGCVDGRYL